MQINDSSNIQKKHKHWLMHNIYCKRFFTHDFKDIDQPIAGEINELILTPVAWIEYIADEDP